MAQHAVGRPGARMHPDQQAGVAALLEQLGVARPGVMCDPVAVRVEQLGNQRVECPAATGAVAIHDDDLGGAGGLGAAHRRVDLLGVELAALLVHRRTTVDLLPHDDAADSLHVTHDQYAH